MPFCHKCGSEIKEEDSFCPQCGATLKIGISKPPKPYRSEKQEKQEKQEKTEKHEKEEKMEKGEQPEKYEKKEFSIFGPLIGGAILILIGFIIYLTVSGILEMRSIFPFFLIIIGAIVIVGVAIGAVMASRRNPIP